MGSNGKVDIVSALLLCCNGDGIAMEDGLREMVAARSHCAIEVWKELR